MTEKKPADKKSKKPSVAKGASRAAKRVLKLHTKLEGGLPIAMIGLTDLANCDPKAGLKPLLTVTRESVYFPVSVNGRGAYSFTLVKEGRDWKWVQTNIGPLSQSVPDAVRKHQNGGGSMVFSLVYIPGVHHNCVAFETEQGEQLVVLERWPSDPQELSTLTQAESVLAILKEQAQKQLAHSVVHG